MIFEKQHYLEKKEKKKKTVYPLQFWSVITTKTHDKKEIK